MIDTADKKHLERWLRELPEKARTSFATRHALRELPMASGILHHQLKGMNGEGYLLSCFRANLISGVVGTWPAPQISEGIIRFTLSARSDLLSARSAAQFADSARPALSAALTALSARSVSSAPSTADSVLSARSPLSTRSTAHSTALVAADFADSAALSAAPNDTIALFGLPLWSDEIPEHLATQERRFADISASTP